MQKNQPDFKPWTIASLAEELIKASRLLANHKNAQVRFYSRSPFSTLAKLREYAITQDNEASYRANLSKNNVKVDADLAKILSIAASGPSVYEFLCKTTFETSPELGSMENFLHFWVRHLVPVLMDTRDTEGLTTHV